MINYINCYKISVTLNGTINAGLVFLLKGFSDRVPALGDHFGPELQSHRACPLLHETEPHQLCLQHHHHEPTCGRCVGEFCSLL